MHVRYSLKKKINSLIYLLIFMAYIATMCPLCPPFSDPKFMDYEPVKYLFIDNSFILIRRTVDFETTQRPRIFVSDGWPRFW